MILNITRTTHQGKQKPKGAEIGKIQNEIKRNREELTPSELLQAITKDKRHFQATATRYDEETGSKPFESASLVVLDIDNEVSSAREQLDARTLITVLDSLNLPPLTVYSTDSHQLKHFPDTTPKEKLRVVFQLPEVVTNLKTFKTITDAIRKTIIDATQCSEGAIDDASEKPAQLFYGTDRGSIIPEVVGAFILDEDAINQPYESLEPLNHVRLVDVVYNYLEPQNKAINKEKSSDKAKQKAKERLYNKTIEQLVSDLSPQEFKENIPKPEQIQHRDIPRDFLPYVKLLQAVERGLWIEGLEQTPENLDHAPVAGSRLRGDVLWYIASSLDYIKGGLAWLREVMKYHIARGTRDVNGNPVYERRHIELTNYRNHRGKSGLPKYNPTTLQLISPYTSDHQYQNILAVVPEGKRYQPAVIGEAPETPTQSLVNVPLSLSKNYKEVWDRLHEEDTSGTPKTAPIVSGIRIDTGAGKTRQLQEQIKPLLIQAYHYELGLAQSTPDVPVIAFSTHALKNEFLDELTDWIEDFKASPEYDALQRQSKRIIKPELQLEDYILTTPEIPKPPEGVELEGYPRSLYDQLLRAYEVKSEKASDIRQQLINALQKHPDQQKLRELREALIEYGGKQQQVYGGTNRYDKVVLTTHQKALDTDETGIYSQWNDPNSTRGRHLIYDEEPLIPSTTITPQTWSIFKSIFSDEEGNLTYGKEGIEAIEKWMNSDRIWMKNPLHDPEKYNAPAAWKTVLEQFIGKAWEAIQKQASEDALEQGTGNPLDILDAPFLVRDNHGNITGDTPKPLPYLQYTVLSATMTPETLKSHFSENIQDDESNLNYIDTSPVNLLGRVHQRPIEETEHNLSHSKAAINRSETQDRIIEDLRDKDIGAIITTKETKKRYNEALGLPVPEVHYGNTLGSNELKGKNIAVVGDWNLPDNKIINLYLLENPDTDPETLDLRKGKVRVTWNNITVTMWTFKHHEGLRYIHLREDEKQIMQAVGRARAIREDVDVYVYARIPLSTYWTSGKAKEDEQEAPREVLQTYSIRDEPPPKSDPWNPWEQPNPPPPVEG